MITIVSIILDLAIFMIIIGGLSFIKDKSLSFYNKRKIKNIGRWLPIEQFQEFKQLGYLIFAGLLFADLYYLILINTSLNYILTCVIFDFIISIIAGIYIFDKNNLTKTIIILLTLVPLTGFTFTGFEGSLGVDLFLILEITHSLGIIYVIYHCIQSFKKYSRSNKLGYTILLLYVIVFVCVFLTTYAENINLLDSLVYCSNAFTSNGYGLVNATNYQGKIISVVLVWAGYILSGVSTAILTGALITKYYKKKFFKVKNQMKKQELELKQINEKLDVLLDKKD